MLHQVPEYCPQYIIRDYTAWDENQGIRINDNTYDYIDDLEQSPKRAREFNMEEMEQARRWDENPYQSSPVLFL